MKFPDVWTRKVVEVAIFHKTSGHRTNAYTRMPKGTQFFWAMNIKKRRVQLWASDAHGQPVLAIATPDQYYFADHPPEEEP